MLLPSLWWLLGRSGAINITRSFLLRNWRNHLCSSPIRRSLCLWDGIHPTTACPLLPQVSPPLPKHTTTQFTASLKSPRELLFCSYTHEKKQPDSFTVGHRWGCYMVLVTIHTSTAALSRNSQMSVWKDWAWLKIQASDGWSTQSQGLWHSKEGFPVNQVAQFKVQYKVWTISQRYSVFHDEAVSPNQNSHWKQTSRNSYFRPLNQDAP